MTAPEYTLRRAILRALIQCGGYLCPESALKDQVSLNVVPLPSQSDFDEALRTVDAERLVINGQGPIERTWKITEAGKVWAKENRV